MEATRGPSRSPGSNQAGDDWAQATAGYRKVSKLGVFQRHRASRTSVDDEGKRRLSGSIKLPFDEQLGVCTSYMY